jgi:hypothetical protein
MIRVHLPDGEELRVDFADDEAAALFGEAVVDLLVRAGDTVRELEQDLIAEAEARRVAVSASGTTYRKVVFACIPSRAGTRAIH